jgi:hypothetical protein
MRATDHRYHTERARFDLALRMIGHEARTGTIKYWTGLSEDRIRKLYTSYFKFGGRPVRRRRGRSPSQIAPLIKTPQRALESGVFANLLLANGLLTPKAGAEPDWQGNVDLGHRFCECYETHQALVPRASLSFEWGWNLLLSIQRGDELGITRCSVCSVGYIFDVLALPKPVCPACATFALNDRRAVS